jgi:hypothetical protein
VLSEDERRRLENWARRIGTNIPTRPHRRRQRHPWGVRDTRRVRPHQPRPRRPGVGALRPRRLGPAAHHPRSGTAADPSIGRHTHRGHQRSAADHPSRTPRRRRPDAGRARLDVHNRTASRAQSRGTRPSRPPTHPRRHRRVGHPVARRSRRASQCATSARAADGVRRHRLRTMPDAEPGATSALPAHIGEDALRSPALHGPPDGARCVL